MLTVMSFESSPRYQDPRTQRLRESRAQSTRFSLLTRCKAAWQGRDFTRPTDSQIPAHPQTDTMGGGGGGDGGGATDAPCRHHISGTCEQSNSFRPALQLASCAHFRVIPDMANRALLTKSSLSCIVQGPRHICILYDSPLSRSDGCGGHDP